MKIQTLNKIGWVLLGVVILWCLFFKTPALLRMLPIFILTTFIISVVYIAKGNKSNDTETN